MLGCRVELRGVRSGGLGGGGEDVVDVLVERAR